MLNDGVTYLTVFIGFRYETVIKWPALHTRIVGRMPKEKKLGNANLS